MSTPDDLESWPLNDDVTDVGEISRKGLDRSKSGLNCKYSHEIGEKIARMVELGSSLAAAARAAGFSVKTVYQWYSRGKGKSHLPSKAMYVRFYKMIRKAQGLRIQNSLERLEEAAKGGFVTKRRIIPQKGDLDPIIEETCTPPDAKVDQWLLACLDREHFGNHKKIEHSGDRPTSTTLNIQNNMTNLTDGERLVLARLLEKMNGPEQQEPKRLL